jgi:hypothetical protein
VAKSVKRPPVDWDKVPVIITGTPDPYAIQLLVQSIRKFEVDQLMAGDAAARSDVSVATMTEASHANH